MQEPRNRKWLRLSLRTWFVLLSLLCVAAAVGRIVSQRLVLEKRITEEGTLIYGSKRQHARTVNYWSRFGSGTGGPDPKVTLQDWKFLPAISRWTNGSLAATTMQSIRSHGSVPEWVNDVLGSGELTDIYLKQMPSQLDDVDLGLIALNHQLESLSLSGCKQQPTIFAGFAQLKDLKAVKIADFNCDFRSLRKNGFAPNVEELSILSSQFESEDLGMLRNCKRLRILSLAASPVDLHAISDNGLPRSLIELNMASTRFSKSCLKALRTCDQLEELNLRKNGIDLRSVEGYSLPKSLKVIAISGCQIDRSTLAMLAKLPNLKELDLNETSLLDEYAEGITLPKTLETFLARGTRAGPNVCSMLRDAQGLNTLNFAQTDLDDRSLQLMGDKPKLTMMLAGETKLTNQCASWLMKIEKLRRLELYSTGVDRRLLELVPKLKDVPDLRGPFGSLKPPKRIFTFAPETTQSND